MSQYRSPTAEDSPELFRTTSGSRLYGIAHANSDIDIFVVTSSTLRMAVHEVRPDADWSFRGLDYFLGLALSGSHQACEAAFAPAKEFTAEGAQWKPYLDALRVSSPDAFAKYERTIASFSFGDFKRRRHAARLAFNLRMLRAHGRFNPVMTANEIRLANAVAENLRDTELAAALLPGVRLDYEHIMKYTKLGKSRFGRTTDSS